MFVSLLLNLRLKNQSKELADWSNMPVFDPIRSVQQTSDLQLSQVRIFTTTFLLCLFGRVSLHSSTFLSIFKHYLLFMELQIIWRGSSCHDHSYVYTSCYLECSLVTNFSNLSGFMHSHISLLWRIHGPYFLWQASKLAQKYTSLLNLNFTLQFFSLHFK